MFTQWWLLCLLQESFGLRQESATFRGGEKVEVKRLSKSELDDLHNNRGMHPAAAQQVFDEQFRLAAMQQFGLLQTSEGRAKPRQQATDSNEPPHAHHELRSDDDMAILDLLDNADELVREVDKAPKKKHGFPHLGKRDKKEKKEHRSNQTGANVFVDDFNRFKSKAKYKIDRGIELTAQEVRRVMVSLTPMVQVHICFQMNIDLSMVPPYIPFFRISLAVSGRFFWKPQTSCWGGELQTSIGVKWGLKFLGMNLGLAAYIEGTLDFEEQTPNTALKSGAPPESHVLFAPHGADLSVCHSKSPFPSLMTFYENYVRKVVNSQAMQKQIEEKKAEHAKDVEAFYKVHQALLQTTPVKLENEPQIPELLKEERFGFLKDKRFERNLWIAEEKSKARSGLIVAPSLTAVALVIDGACANVLEAVSGLATQVIYRLVDSSNWIGPDSEVRHTNSMKRFQTSDGRFLARWPSFTKLESMGQGKVKEDSKRWGIHKFRPDMRVLNFAKVMENSVHRNKIDFWQEIAVSSSNLMLRMIDGIRASVALIFANDPNWDGTCESLYPNFEVGKYRKAGKHFVWPSSWIKKSYRTDFLSQLERKEGLMFPHVWCRLAKQTKLRRVMSVLSSRTNAPPVARKPRSETSLLDLGQGRDFTRIHKRDEEEDDDDDEDEGDDDDEFYRAKPTTTTTTTRVWMNKVEELLARQREQFTANRRVVESLMKQAPFKVADDTDQVAFVVEEASEDDATEAEDTFEEEVSTASASQASEEEDDTDFYWEGDREPDMDKESSKASERSGHRSPHHRRATGSSGKAPKEGEFLATVTQACTTVSAEYRLLREHELIKWDKITQNFRVVNPKTGLGVGLLWGTGHEGGGWYGAVPKDAYPEYWDERMPKADVRMVADRRGFHVAERTVIPRPECEETVFGVVHQRLLPTFLKWVRRVVATLELKLLQINICLGEEFYAQATLDMIKDDLPDQKGKLTEEYLRSVCKGLRSEEQTFEWVRERAMDVFHSVRRRLSLLGAENPKNSYYYDEGVVPIGEYDGYSDETSNAKQTRSVLDVIKMDLDAAVGIVTEDTHYSSDHDKMLLKGVRVRVRDGILSKWWGTVAANVPKGAGNVRVVSDDTFEVKVVRVDKIDRVGARVALSGLIWRQTQKALAELMSSNQKDKEFKSRAGGLRPPVTFVTTLRAGLALKHYDFCKPLEQHFTVSGAYQKRWSSWDQSKALSAWCFVGQGAPGPFFLRIERCWSPGKMAEWRVHYAATILSLNAFPDKKKGMFSGELATLVSDVSSKIADGAEFNILGDVGTTVQKHPVTVAVTALLVAATPKRMLSLDVTTGPNAIKINKNLFSNIADGLVSRLKSCTIGVDDELRNSMTAEVQLMAYGTTTFRETDLRLKRGPNQLLQEIAHGRGPVKFGRASSFHLILRSRVGTPTFAMDGAPGSSWVSLMASLDISFDASTWLKMFLFNRRQRFQEDKSVLCTCDIALQRFAQGNEKRWETCKQCLRRKYAFCDWRPILANVWKPEYDVCVEDTDEELDKCTGDSGLSAKGKPLRGLWFSAKEGSDCESILLPKFSSKLEKYDGKLM